ncbi:MAG: hypothetical protein QUS14_04240 [Pyrinomonadaceae bacterium]|nr:hypothetical protein [Pyrinomonadaceae bacterium]
MEFIVRGQRIPSLLQLFAISFAMLVSASVAAAQSETVKQLNAAVEQMNLRFEGLTAEVDRGSATVATVRSLDEIVAFRERWWAPGGTAETQMGVYPGGSIRDAYELRARAKLLLNDHSGALADFAKVLTTSDPGEGPLASRNFEKLFAHIDSHKTLAERMTDIDAVIKRAPGVGRLFLKRAGFHDDTTGSYWDKTAADLETALRLSPQEADIYEAALDVYFQLQQGDKALAVLNKAVRELPLNFRFHRIRADVLRGPQVNDAYTVEGLERLTKAIDECSCKRSNLYYYYRERASVNFDLKRYDAAIADATKAIDIADAMSGGKPATPFDDPDDWTQTVHPYFYRAESFIAKGLYKEALPDLDILVRVNGWGGDFERRGEIRCKLRDVAGPKEDEAAALKDGIEVKNPCK